MADKPINLDDRRNETDLELAEQRRRLLSSADNQAILQAQREQLGYLLASGPAKDWASASSKVSYLLNQFSATPEAQEPQMQELIKQTLIDLQRLKQRIRTKS